MRLDEELACVGFYGFGGGVETGRRSNRGHQPRPGEPIYCNRCPQKNECWQKHRARVREMFPAAAAEFDRILAECGKNGQLAVERFYQMHKSAPDDLTVFAGNMEDGISVGAGALVRDRGPSTLPYPFTSRGHE